MCISSIVSWLRRLRKPRCCECNGTNLALIQWCEGTQVAWVCTQCTVRWGYNFYLVSLREQLEQLLVAVPQAERPL